MGTKFTADPNAAWRGCVVSDPHHSAEPGHWPSGKMVEDVCSSHMANWYRAHEAMKAKLLRPASARPRFLGGR